MKRREVQPTHSRANVSISRDENEARLSDTYMPHRTWCVRSVWKNTKNAGKQNLAATSMHACKIAGSRQPWPTRDGSRRNKSNALAQANPLP